MREEAKETMNLQIGNKYQAHQPGFKDEFEGEPIEFEAVTFEFVVLPKPEQVIANDGVTQEVVPLPKHLAQPDWYLVKNLTKDVNHWFCSKVYEVTAI